MKTATKFKPLLASAIDVDKLEAQVDFPVYASAKLDGVRVVVMDGKVLTRSLKPLPNLYVQEVLGQERYNGLDGEIIVGDPSHPNVFRRTSGEVRRRDGKPEFTFFVFDNFLEPDKPFEDRYSDLPFGGHVQKLNHRILFDIDELNEYEKECLSDGYEGVMLRSPKGRYKFGRSSVKEGILLKLKRFVSREAIIIGFEERMHNANEVKTNALGYTERSSHKDNKVGKGDLGALRVKDIESKAEFSIGTGFDDAARKEIWNKRSELIGEVVRYKSMDYGNYDVPRFPVFEGFRMKEDMS